MEQRTGFAGKAGKGVVRPVFLALVLFALWLSACAPDREPAPEPTVGTELQPPVNAEALPQPSLLSSFHWRLFATKQGMLYFGEDGSVRGSMLCNEFEGEYTAGDSQLTITAHTVSSEPCTDLEQTYMQKFERVASYRFMKSQLVLLDAAGDRLFTYVAIRPPFSGEGPHRIAILPGYNMVSLSGQLDEGETDQYVFHVGADQSISFYPARSWSLRVEIVGEDGTVIYEEKPPSFVGVGDRGFDMPSSIDVPTAQDYSFLLTAQHQAVHYEVTLEIISVYSLTETINPRPPEQEIPEIPPTVLGNTKWEENSLAFELHFSYQRLIETHLMKCAGYGNISASGVYEADDASAFLTLTFANELTGDRSVQCPEVISFFETLNQVAGYRIVDNRLELLDTAGNVLLIFRPPDGNIAPYPGPPPTPSPGPSPTHMSFPYPSPGPLPTRLPYPYP